jgi:hypothetical protein
MNPDYDGHSIDEMSREEIPYDGKRRSGFTTTIKKVSKSKRKTQKQSKRRNR